jgi:hypothetical protein
MSLQASLESTVPEETTRVTRPLFQKATRI